MQDGATARAALDVIEQRHAALEADLKQAVEAQLGTAANALLAEREAAYAEYNTAVAALRAPLERMLSLERTLTEVRERQARLVGNPRSTGGLGGFAHNVVSTLQDRGLCEILIERHDTHMPTWLGWQHITGNCAAFSRDYFTTTALD